MEKKCFECGVLKPVLKFYRNKKMKDGYLNKCKTCVRKDHVKYRKENIDRIRAYDRWRASLPHRRKIVSDYAKTEKGRKSLKKGMEKWNRGNQNKRAAVTILGNAVRDKRIIKKPCEVCGGTTNVDGHHEDYYKPLDVTWLCHKHHMALHKQRREAARQAKPSDG